MSESQFKDRIDTALAILQTVAAQPVQDVEAVRVQVLLVQHHLDSALWALARTLPQNQHN
jgi:hypothetical protein